MRVINAKVVMAVRDLLNNADHNGAYFKGGNTVVSQWHDGPCHTPGYQRVIEVKLHQSTIARIYPDTGRMYIRDCGYRTATTKARLNSLLGAFNGDQISQSVNDWYTSRGEWLAAGNDWQDCHWQVRLDSENPMLKAAELVAAGK
jgi:hypothetical protein